jgi:hypothetical protein
VPRHHPRHRPDLKRRDLDQLRPGRPRPPPGAAVYPPGDEVLLPSFGGLDRQCDAIRFKSYAAGTPANVKLTAIPGPPGGG